MQVAKHETRLIVWHAMCILALGTARKNDVKRHIERECHRTKASALSRMGGGIAWYFAAGTEVDRVTAADFITKSNLLLAITDDFSKMVGKMFPDSDIAKKFSAGRTTTIKTAIAPDCKRVSFLLLKKN